MRVLQVNTNYQGGGAEKVARQLQEGLRARQIDSLFLAGRNRYGAKDCITIYRNVPSLVYNRILQKVCLNAPVHDPYAMRILRRTVREQQIDLIHMHNLHDHYLGVGDMAEIASLRPVIWTLHDMWAITGHCAYEDCTRWQTGCGECPNLRMHPRLALDITEKLWQVKKNAYSNRNIYFVTPSQWLKRQVENSFLAEEKVTVIPNGINVERWIPYDKKEIRERYGLPQNKRYLMILAPNGSNSYKGGRYLTEVLKGLPEKENYVLLAVGKGDELLEELNSCYQVEDFGYVRDERKMNEIYSMADLFLLTSIYDNFPCTTLEAFASGTPCIGFATGGIAEQIHEDTGWIVERKNTRKFVRAIENAFSDRQALAIKAENCRREAVEKCAESLMIQRYCDLYERVLQKQR